MLEVQDRIVSLSTKYYTLQHEHLQTKYDL
jgi:hypothetical protein